VKLAGTIVVLLGLAAGAADDKERAHVGELLAKSHGRVELRMDDTQMHIGFVADEAALAQLDTLKVGDQVRLVFGSVPKAGHFYGINKLLRARRCGPVDAQCTADQIVQRAERAESDRKSELAIARQAQCRQSMDLTLRGDKRYIAAAPQPATDATVTWEKLRALKGTQKRCANAVLDHHRQAFVDACQHHQCGEDVAGGCDHVARWVSMDAAAERAYQLCR